MQLIALNGEKNIWAADAKRGEIYTCPECGYALRKRGGLLMRAHFYHIYKGPKCKGSNKSICHYKTQEWLCKKIPDEGLEIEYPFPEIGRRADVYWPRKKIVFEVQYSGITASEMAERCRDYASIGIYTVWILHTHFFKPHPSLERNLRNIPHYYTNINAQGMGYVFDQIVTSEGMTQPTIVNLGRPSRIGMKPKVIPDCFYARFKHFAFYFDGDLIDKAYKGHNVMPRRYKAPKPKIVKWLDRIIKKHNLG